MTAYTERQTGVREDRAEADGHSEGADWVFHRLIHRFIHNIMWYILKDTTIYINNALQMPSQSIE